jgi:hypothetical protein
MDDIGGQPPSGDTAGWGAPAVHPLLSGLGEVGAGFDKLMDAALWALSDQDVRAAVESSIRAVAQAQGLLVRLVGEYDARDLAKPDAAVSTITWLRHRHRMGPSEATGYVKAAQQTRADLAATGHALDTGTISYAQAAAITRSLADLGGVDPERRAQAETHLLGEARTHDPVILSRLGRHITAHLEPDSEDRADQKAMERAEQRARNNMFLTFSPDGEGGSYLRGRLDPESAATVRAALEPLAKWRPTQADGPDLRPTSRRNADALVELARRCLAAGDMPDVGAEKPNINVTIPFDYLVNELGTATLAEGYPISAGTARRLACDGGVIPAVLDGHGCPLDVGRKQRLFTGAVRRAVILRDHGCAFPGCDRPATWCQIHHIVPWWRGGKTALSNGVALCTHHHRLVEQGEWVVHIDPADGLPTWTPPAWIDPDRKPQRNAMHRRP